MLEDIKSNIVRLISLYEGEKQRADLLAEKLKDKTAIIIAASIVTVLAVDLVYTIFF